MTNQLNLSHGCRFPKNHRIFSFRDLYYIKNTDYTYMYVYMFCIYYICMYTNINVYVYK